MPDMIYLDLRNLLMLEKVGDLGERVNIVEVQTFPFFSMLMSDTVLSSQPSFCKD